MTGEEPRELKVEEHDDEVEVLIAAKYDIEHTTLRANHAAGN